MSHQHPSPLAEVWVSLLGMGTPERETNLLLLPPVQASRWLLSAPVGEQMDVDAKPDWGPARCGNATHV